MKLKHNKLRNTSILFELLVRQITTDTLSNKDSKAVDILKKHYNKTNIAKEYKIYKTLAEAKNLSEAKATALINIAIEAYNSLNKNALKREKYSLIADIKESYNIDEFFKAKVDNYKTLASIYMLFEMKDFSLVDIDKESQYRFTIMESISNVESKKEKDPILEQYQTYDKGTKALIYKLLIQKFNEKYSYLGEDQKNLLKEYITNISTSDKLREYVNEEFSKVKKSLNKITSNLKDEVRKVKLTEVSNFIELVPENKQVCEKDIHNLLSYYSLINEFNSIS
jgi:16S rRNA G966 N2-methylase RsmD